MEWNGIGNASWSDDFKNSLFCPHASLGHVVFNLHASVIIAG